MTSEMISQTVKAKSLGNLIPLLLSLIYFFFLSISSAQTTFSKVQSGVLVTDTEFSQGSFWADFDSDGDLDVFIANRNELSNNSMYRNDGQGVFTKLSEIDVGAIVNDGGQDSRGGGWADFDNDGDLDLFVTNRSDSTEANNNLLYQNQYSESGVPTFISIIVGAIVHDGGDSQVSSWGDYNNDGFVDLIVANNYPRQNFLYRNNRDGSFSPVTNILTIEEMSSFGASWGDYDNDGDLDLFVSNTGEEDNSLYRNDRNGVFINATDGAGLLDGGNSKGESWADINNDGFLDLYVNNEDEPNFLYINNHNGTFRKLDSIEVGSIVSDISNSRSASWGDYDNDGDLDLYVANRSNELNNLYQNELIPYDSLFFTKIESEPVVNDQGHSSSSNWVDYDDDGDLDLFVANGVNEDGEVNHLYRNNGSGFNWLKIRLNGNESNSFGIGAKIRIKTIVNSRTVWQLREISSQHGGFGQNGLIGHFGLNDAQTVDSIEVEWPSGIVQSLVDQSSNQTLVISEPELIAAVTENPKNIIPTSTTLRGIVSGLAANIYFEWGTDTTYGDTVRAIPRAGQHFSPDTLVNATLFNLEPNTTYHYRLLAENAAGKSTGLDKSFITSSAEGIFKRVTDFGIGRDRAESRGSSWIDFDNDGQLDLFVVNHGANFLYRNLGNDTFSQKLEPAEVGPIVRDESNSSGHSWADFDNDGDIDVYICKFGKNLFYRNEVLPSGNPGFVQVLDGSLVNDVSNSTSSSWVDIDNDGWLDLFVANIDGNANSLYRNDGDRTFTKLDSLDVGDVVADVGPSLGSAWADFDNDGDQDLFVANFENENNYLYKNELSQTGNATFTKVTSSVVCNDRGYSRGGSWGDYNNDGLPDLFVANSDMSRNFLYKNMGNGIFEKITTGEVVEDDIDSGGSAWADFDNDGDLDLLTINFLGDGEANYIYDNNGTGVLTRIDAGTVSTDSMTSEGGSWGDFDNDGDLDLFVTTNDSSEHNLFYLNNHQGNNWSKISLAGVVSNRSAIGAKIQLKANISGIDIWQSRQISSQTGKFSQNSLEAHFGLGNATIIDSVIIDWPDGLRQTFTNLAINERKTFEEIENLAPVIISPGSGSENLENDLTFIWQTASGASSYTLELSTNAVFTPPVVIQYEDIPDTTLRITNLANNSNYYWRVRANYGNESSNYSVSSQFKMSKNINLSQTFTFENRANARDFSAKDWQIIGVPGASAIVVSDLMIGENGTDWEAYWDNGTPGDSPEDYLVKHNDTPSEFAFGGGRAFWIIRRGNFEINQEADALTLSDSGFVKIALQANWNLITNPYPTRVKWSDVRNVNNFQADVPIHRYESNGSYTSSMNMPNYYMEPYIGYYFNNDPTFINLDSLKIPYPHNFLGVPAQAENSEKAWHLDISLTQSNIPYGRILLGTSELASDQHDQFDFRKPRGIAQVPQIFFDRSTWNINSGHYISDIQPEGKNLYTWRFKVSSAKGKNSTLTISNINSITSNLGVVLVHQDNSHWVDLRTSSTYNFQPSLDISNFSILVGNEAILDEQIANLLPSKFALGINYPNPFNPSTILPIDIPETTHLDLMVYDISGQLVKTVYSSIIEAGRYKFQWNGLNDGGQTVASGIYIVRMHSRSYSASRKIILLK